MQVTIQDLTGAECGDIAITAIEGGIGYWAQADSYQPSRWSPDSQHEAYIKGEAESSNLDVTDDFVFYTIHELDDDERNYKEEGVDITPALIRRGFEKALTEARSDLVAPVLTMAREDWMGFIDADGADVIIQLGALGEIKWG